MVVEELGKGSWDTKTTLKFIKKVSLERMLTSFFDVILTTAGAEVSTNSLMFLAAQLALENPKHAIKM